jgi:hypothetical protein
LSVGPETTTEGDAIVAGSTSAPASSWIRKLTWIFSPGSMVPSPLFVPDSSRVSIRNLRPGSKLGSWSGCRCASVTASGLPEAAWHSRQLALFAWAPIGCPFAV